ncbi:MAG: hypothetical protein IJU50_02645 [Lachnospiraceae bacterium]|nr:hypothetical protein [Lachnospiraceae bacterium]
MTRALPFLAPVFLCLAALFAFPLSVFGAQAGGAEAGEPFAGQAYGQEAVSIEELDPYTGEPLPSEATGGAENSGQQTNPADPDSPGMDASDPTVSDLPDAGASDSADADSPDAGASDSADADFPDAGASDPNAFTEIMEIDPFSGSAGGFGDSSPVRGMTRLSASMFYDLSSNLYAYPNLSGDGYVYADVADGMLTNSAVSLYPGETLIRLYKDGEALEWNYDSPLTAPGTYLVQALWGDSEQRILTFTVVGNATNLSAGYRLPAGFSIENATRNGEAAWHETGYIGMEEEGAYHIEYTCERIGRSYSLDITVDRTPPALSFTNLNEKMRTRNEVEVSGLQESETMTVFLNGKELENPGALFRKSGNYVIIARDAAGNTAEYRFTILLYLNVEAYLFVSLLILSIASVFAYLIWQQKHFRVR